MYLKKQKSFLLGLVLALGLTMLIVPDFAYAQRPTTGLVPCGGYNENGTRKKPCTFLDTFALIARVTNWLVGVAGLYAVYNIISNSFWLVLAQGNEETITTHKKGISNAIVGMVIVFMAFMFINTAVNLILVNGAKGYKLDLTNPVCYLSPTTLNQCFVPTSSGQ